MHKIKHKTAYAAVIIFLFLQILLSNIFTDDTFKPNVMIIATVFFALFTDRGFGCKIGVICGALLDFFSIRMFGLNTILFAVCGYIIGRFNTKFYRESIITHFIITLVSSFFIMQASYLFIMLRYTRITQNIVDILLLHKSVLISSLLNSCLSVFIFVFLCRIFNLSGHEI